MNFQTNFLHCVSDEFSNEIFRKVVHIFYGTTAFNHSLALKYEGLQAYQINLELRN